MIKEYGTLLQITPKMFKEWQAGEIDTLRLASSMAFQGLAEKITEETENGVEIEIRVRESKTKLPPEDV